jgi:putative nucleotidyltransferase with HDIG domain
VWQHEDLFAPFNFSIDKSADELKRERDSVLREFSPRYDMNAAVYAKVLDTITCALSAHFGEECPKKNQGEFFRNHNLGYFYQTLQRLYEEGIYDVKRPYKTLVIEQGAQRSRVLFTSVHSLTEAWEILLNSLPKKRQAELKPVVSHLLQANLFYNETHSAELKERLLAGISEKYGFVSEGSRIISRGDVVNEETMNILNSLRKEYEAQKVTSGNKFFILLGQLILIFVAFVVLFLLLSFTHVRVLRNRKYSFFIVTIVVLFIAMAAVTMKFELISMYAVPYIALPIIIKNFVNRRVAVFSYIIAILIIGFLAPNSYDFVFMQICVGSVALFAIGNHYERSTLLITAFVSMISYVVIYLGFSLMKEGSLAAFNFIDILWFAVSCTLLLTTYLFIFVFERVFGLTSDLTYFELADTNKGILRELNEKAPGTFQHSLQVANLTEAALQKIQGNVMLGRTAALYHDIGKLKKPQYFIENQSFGENPHDKLEPEESAQILINHVIYGHELALKHNLPLQLSNMIYSHHGNSKAAYFLAKQKTLHPNQVDESKFTYPKFYMKDKELAVLMIADVVEATTRTIQTFSHEKIDEVVSRLIDEMIENKRLKNFDITLREIEKVRAVLIEKLVNIYHSRIAYPPQTTTINE